MGPRARGAEFGARHPLRVASLVTVAIGVLARVLPLDWAGTSVGLAFFGASYWLVLRGSNQQIKAAGLSLGGLFTPEPLRLDHVLRATRTSLLWCVAAALIFFPPYALGHHLYFATAEPFAFSLGPDGFDLAAHHLIAVALPEEMFYRGYLQSALDPHWPATRRVFGARVGWSLLVTSAIFALGHLIATPSLGRLSVFFPSLAFGWLRARTGGIGASVLFHALCNLLSTGLAQGAVH